MAGKEYRFGVIGAGMIGQYHAEAIKQLDNAKLIAVCDHASGAAEQFGARCGCRGMCELNGFLASDEIDVVTVATPSGTHADIAIAAAKHGKHCIVEKPIDINLDKIDAAIEAHQQAGTTLGGIFNMRYEPVAKIFKEAVDQERFGKLTFGMAYGPWWRDQDYYDKGGWKGTWAMDGGGAFMNQGIHTIDMLQWLMGPVKQVSAYTKTLAHERIEVEDTGAVAVEFENGALGTMACTTSMWPGHFRIVEVAGDKGTAGMADSNFLFWQFAEETEKDEQIRKEYLGFPGASVGAANPSAGLSAEYHRANFFDFLKALDDGSIPPVSGEEARKAVAIILAIYESAKSGKPVEVK
jgi:predicted dehydrogenase